MDNSTPDMSEKLVLYLDGELAGVEKENLEQQLTADKVLQGQLDSLKSTREAVKLYGLQQKVSVIHHQMMKELQPRIKKTGSAGKFFRYSIAVAAGLLLIIGGVLIGFGSRYAGGCTSGHAISGMSNLQIPSLKAVIGFFVGGLIMAHFILPLIF